MTPTELWWDPSLQLQNKTLCIIPVNPQTIMTVWLCSCRSLGSHGHTHQLYLWKYHVFWYLLQHFIPVSASVIYILVSFSCLTFLCGKELCFSSFCISSAERLTHTLSSIYVNWKGKKWNKKSKKMTRFSAVILKERCFNIEESITKLVES